MYSKPFFHFLCTSIPFRLCCLCLFASLSTISASLPFFHHLFPFSFLYTLSFFHAPTSYFPFLSTSFYPSRPTLFPPYSKSFSMAAQSMLLLCTRTLLLITNKTDYSKCVFYVSAMPLNGMGWTKTFGFEFQKVVFAQIVQRTRRGKRKCRKEAF